MIGQPITQAEFDAKKHEWIPSEEDQRFVKSLMQRVTEPGVTPARENVQATFKDAAPVAVVTEPAAAGAALTGSGVPLLGPHGARINGQRIEVSGGMFV